MTYARKRIGAWVLAVLVAAVCALLPGTFAKIAQAEGDEPIEVATQEALQTVVDEVNSGVIGETRTVLLTENVAVSGGTQLTLNKGELTILGGGHTLEATFLLKGTTVLNLGKDGDEEGLTVIPNRTDCGVFDLSNASTLNVYDGTVIGPATPVGTAGGVQAHHVSVFNMYGGTITGCESRSVAGGVYLDGNAVFNMYGGTIKDCVGYEGGAVGLSGGAPIGGSGEGTTAFHMHGGTIKDCVDKYNGGGAVCAFTSYPVIVTMDGGTIKNCSVDSSSRAYGGGGVMLFVFADLVFKMDGGKIIDNTCVGSRYQFGGGLIVYCTGSNVDVQLNKGTISGNSADVGGGVFAYRGAMTIADGFGLHNNTATTAGDDIYNNATDVNLGTVDTSATLKACGHKITGWYEDLEARWSYGDCTSNDEHLELFEHTGEVYAVEYGLKAAHGIPTHTVTWVNDDGTVLEEETDVPEGEEPPYEGPEPTKEPSDGNEYTFTGWEKEVDEETGNVTYTAVFEATPIPTEAPTAEPTEQPTEKPTAEPTADPTAEPTAAPTAKPTEKPEPSPVPPTDDRSPIVLWAVLCAASLLGVCALLVFKKRKADGRE